MRVRFGRTCSEVPRIRSHVTPLLIDQRRCLSAYCEYVNVRVIYEEIISDSRFNVTLSARILRFHLSRYRPLYQRDDLAE